MKDGKPAMTLSYANGKTYHTYHKGKLNGEAKRVNPKDEMAKVGQLSILPNF